MLSHLCFHAVAMLCCFLSNDPAPTEIHTYLLPLSLHDALPIYRAPQHWRRGGARNASRPVWARPPSAALRRPDVHIHGRCCRGRRGCGLAAACAPTQRNRDRRPSGPRALPPSPTSTTSQLPQQYTSPSTRTTATPPTGASGKE